MRQHPRMAFGMEETINVWLRDKSPNWNLAILIALQLQRNWNDKIQLITVASDKNDERRLYSFLERLSDRARLPSQTEFFVLTGEFREAIAQAPTADVNLYGLPEVLDFDLLREIPTLTRTSCLFIKDSGYESALA